ncbi:hypothetical protein FQA47_023305 [Oryzias melastigma]|uniref:Uncharacterized protein n=1 Tax=Oryzias melastigma TaxID=30732 RepID=A0A834CFM7_ORYME|nr:hypothetical protein FQA47_023305 [Oryzias melastigma]
MLMFITYLPSILCSWDTPCQSVPLCWSQPSGHRWTLPGSVLVPGKLREVLMEADSRRDGTCWRKAVVHVCECAGSDMQQAFRIPSDTELFFLLFLCTLSRAMQQVGSRPRLEPTEASTNTNNRQPEHEDQV